MGIDIKLASDEDLEAIRELQKETLAANVDADEKHKEGFVSLETPLSILKKIQEQIGMVCAFDENGQLVGYEIPLPLDIAKDLSFLDPFIERVLKLSHNGIPFRIDNSVIEGQINVRQGFKGVGIAELLHEKFLALVGEKYQLVVTEVSDENPRSYNAHIGNLGMDIIQTFKAYRREWYILAQETTS